MKTNIDAAEIASKRFGQNFLKDHRYVDQIIQAMPDDDLPVVEIGPGLGDLTAELLGARQVTAFEVDRELCVHLRNMFSPDLKSGKLKLICNDVFEEWSQRGLVDEPYHLVANLPYYIATHIILEALHDPMCQSLLVMVQKEVALKFSARPGERAFSALSVLTESAGEGRVLFDVPAVAFVPQPRITSAVLSVHKKRALSDHLFEAFLKTAFAQPRKKLIKNLEERFQKEMILRAFARENLDPLTRPHQVATSAYHQIYTFLTKDANHGQNQH
jgi:16S rRNA (adenine1518-N6/adenine1519-N6)-dimethyltransferase